MRFVSAILAMLVFYSVEADGPVSLAQQTLDQGQAHHATCINGVTAATAIAFTGFGVATAHTPGGGVAGLLIGAGVGHFLFGPVACDPDPIP